MKVGMDTPGFHHLALRVTDLERARRFYTETLGKCYVAFKDPDRISWELYMA